MKKKLIAIFKIIRPVNFLITFVSVIVASIICFPQGFSEFKVLIAAFSVGLALAGGNVINDINDIEIDRINQPLRPLPSGIISKKEAYILYFFFVVISLFLSVLISIPAFLVVLFSHLALFLYSKILKGILLAGNITVAFLTGLVFIFSGLVVENPAGAFVPAVFAFLINLIREIVKDMEDIEGDRKAGVVTFPIKFGFQKAKFLILLFTFSLILFTLYPFLTRLYRIEYFVVVMVVVNPLLVYCLKEIFEVPSPGSLKKISNLLKLSMVFGLIAIYFGV